MSLEFIKRGKCIESPHEAMSNSGNKTFQGNSGHHLFE